MSYRVVTLLEYTHRDKQDYTTVLILHGNIGIISLLVFLFFFILNS